MANGQKERAQAGVEGDWIQVGSIGAPHGVKGDMRLKSFTENPVAIFKFNDLRLGAGGKAIALVKKGKSKDGFIIHIDGVNSPEEASGLKTKGLYAPRDAFGDTSDDEFFLADLIGLKAVDLSGTEIGIVTTLDNFGAEDLLEVALHKPVKGLGRNIFVPFSKALVPDINVAEGFAVVDFVAWQETQTSERDIDGDEDIDSKGENR